MRALIVCSRFSAWSKTMDAEDSKTSSVTSNAAQSSLLEDVFTDLVSPIVQGRKAVQELHIRVVGVRA